MSDYSLRKVKIDGVVMTVDDVQNLDPHDLYVGLLRMDKDLEYRMDSALFAERRFEDLRKLFDSYLSRPININLYEGKDE